MDKTMMVLGSSSRTLEGMVGGVEEAPMDGTTYGRMDRGWTRLDTEDAPSDGRLYGRRNGNWEYFPNFGPWNNVLFETGYSGSMQVRLISDTANHGIIDFRGNVTGPAWSHTGAPTQIVQLPVGHRPVGTVRVAVPSRIAGANPDSMSVIVVSASGACIIWSIGVGVNPIEAWFDGVSFTSNIVTDVEEEPKVEVKPLPSPPRRPIRPR